MATSAHAKRNIVGFVLMHTVVKENGTWVRSLETAEIVKEFMLADFGKDFNAARDAAWAAHSEISKANRETAGYMVWNIYRNGDRHVR